MAEDDIYKNKGRYEKLVSNIQDYCKEPEKNSQRKYWIRHKPNVKYFEQLFKKFDARDISFIRRLRLIRTFMVVNYVLDKDLATATREDIDDVMAYSHKINLSLRSKQDFPIDVKFLWKQLFPEKDEKGRIDDTLFPYVVRHLSGKIDKSKEKMRGDKFSMDEFERLVQAFSDEPRIQALLTIAFETLGRPQELLGRKIKDVEMFDNYAKIYITEHGKEGVGFLRVIDSYSYLAEWLRKHPLRKDPNAYLFVNTGRVNRYKQMTPFSANKLIRDRCKHIKLNKPITLYSLKRNGITMMRLQGRSDLDVQHVARWTSTQQLKTYDLSNQEESFKIELIRRGKIKAEGKYKEFAPLSKRCGFCGQDNTLSESICSNCKRPLDREIIEKQERVIEAAINKQLLTYDDVKEIVREMMEKKKS